MKQKTGFIIVNYNDFKTTITLLENIKNYHILDKIVVVDNCSTDDSYEQLSKLENDKITIIRSGENKGYASGLNLGAKYLINEYKECNLIFSNADIVIDSEEDIEKLVKILHSKKSYGIVAPVIREHEGLNRGWKIPSPIQDAILNILVIHKYLRPKMLFYKNDYYQSETLVGAVSGCFFGMKSTVLEDVSYFDENTFLYYEENIISTKLRDKKYDVVLTTDVSVFHNHAVTIDKNIHSIKKFKILKKSQVYFQKVYNHANLIELFLLHLTNYTSLMILYVASILKKCIRLERK